MSPVKISYFSLEDQACELALSKAGSFPCNSRDSHMTGGVEMSEPENNDGLMDESSTPGTSSGTRFCASHVSTPAIQIRIPAVLPTADADTMHGRFEVENREILARDGLRNMPRSSFALAMAYCLRPAARSATCKTCM